MCIKQSVGIHGRNDLMDVMIVQILLNLNADRFAGPFTKLKQDGRIGPGTLKAIERYELEVIKLPSSDQMIVPGDNTLTALLAGLPKGPTKEKLGVVMPRAVPKKIDTYFNALFAGMQKYKINTPLRIAHFIAQIAHESACFLYAEELASGAAYEGRKDLGNTQAGDGPRYKGRGLIQLTGRANYAAYSKDAGVDYVAKPQWVATDPAVAVDVACWFWNRNGLNKLADQDDVRSITKRINGGFNGIDERMDYLSRGKAVLGLA